MTKQNSINIKFATLVCLSMLFRYSKLEKILVTLMLTKSVLKNSMGTHIDDTEKFNKRIKEFHEQTEIEFNNLIKSTDLSIKKPVDISNYILEKIYNFLDQEFNIKLDLIVLMPRVDDPVGGAWQLLEAPWIWEWIHIMSIHLDMNCGINGKVYFMDLVQDLIGCVICKSHYVDNKQIMLSGLMKNTLTDIFLKLHTHTKINMGENKFSLNDNSILLENKYKQNYYNEYFKLIK